MITDYQEPSGNLRTLQITVPAEEVAQEIEKVTRGMARQARLPGFRKGKVPVELVKKRFWKDVEEEVARQLIPRHWIAAVQERQLAPVAHPEIPAVAVVEGEPLVFEARFEVRPTIRLAEYRGIPVTRRPAEPTATEIDAAVETLRDNAATFDPIEGRSGGAGDYALIDVAGHFPAAADRDFRHEKRLVEIGHRGNLAGLNETLQGMAAGEERGFQVEVPENADDPGLAGSRAEYSVTLHELKSKVLPDLDEAFLHSLGEFATFDELREHVAGSLRRRIERDNKEQVAGGIFDALIERHPGIEPPVALVEDELEGLLREYARSLRSSGVDIENAPIDWAAMRDELVPAAERRVRQELVLDAIADAEQIAVSAEEMDAELFRLAAAANTTAAALRKRLAERGALQSLAAGMRRTKTLEFLIANAQISEELA